MLAVQRFEIYLGEKWRKLSFYTSDEGLFAVQCYVGTERNVFYLHRVYSPYEMITRISPSSEGAYL